VQVNVAIMQTFVRYDARLQAVFETIRQKLGDADSCEKTHGISRRPRTADEARQVRP